MGRGYEHRQVVVMPALRLHNTLNFLIFVLVTFHYIIKSYKGNEKIILAAVWADMQSIIQSRSHLRVKGTLLIIMPSQQARMGLLAAGVQSPQDAGIAGMRPDSHKHW